MNRCRMFDVEGLFAGDNGVTTLFHEPGRSGGGSADADRTGISEPGEVYLGGFLHTIGTWVLLKAFVVEDLAVAALLAADEEDYIVALGKGTDIGNAVSNLTANGVVVGEEAFDGNLRGGWNGYV